MIYYININQKILAQHFPSLDLVDASILEFVKNWTLSTRSDKLHYDDKHYVWFSHKFIIEQLPMIKIKSRQGIFNRIEKLIEVGLLERHPDNQKMNRVYLALGDKFDVFIHPSPVNETLHPVNETLHTCKDSLTPPVNETLHDNINKDKINNNKREYTRFQKPSIKNLQSYFEVLGLKKFTAGAEAEKFHDYFESNGWKVGGKAPMKDWKAAARNWKRKSKQYTNGSTSVASQPVQGQSFGQL